MSIKFKQTRKISIAPMIDCTDQYYRQLVRLITKCAVVYTEMITEQAINQGRAERLLSFNAIEAPIALQLGGSDKAGLVKAAKLGESYGYNEINLNVGCPSSRVQAGRFGVCLMKEPQWVADCVQAMQQAVSIPVTVKCRIGVDHQDSLEFFMSFIETVKSAGCETFIVHARKAWLKGLSPKQNRTIPPLHYDYVHHLKNTYPELEVIINGGITDLDSAGQFKTLDGMMIGREAYGNPYHLAEVDKRFYSQDHNIRSRKEVFEAFIPYAETALKQGCPLSIIMKHCVGLVHGVAGGGTWKKNWASLVQARSTTPWQTLLDTFPNLSHG